MTSMPSSQPPEPPPRDTISIRNISLHIPVGLDAWGHCSIPQPVLISLNISYDVAAAAAADDVSKTLNYDKLCTSIVSMANARKALPSVDQLTGLSRFAGHVGNIVTDMIALANTKGKSNVDVDILLPQGVLGAVGGVRYLEWFHWMVRDDNSQLYSIESLGTLSVEGCQCTCIIGVNSAERLQKQRTTLDWSAEGKAVSRAMEIYQDATKTVIERVEGSSYKTVEALATMVARTLTMDFGIDSCTVSVMKPSALASVSSGDGAGVQITRSQAFFATSQFWDADADGMDSSD